MNFSIIVDRWDASIGPDLDDGTATFGLRLFGKARSRGVLNDHECEVMIHPGKHRLADDKSAYGFTGVHGVSDGQPLCIELWPGQATWEELWFRSRVPPSRTLISMQTEAGTDDPLLTGRIFVTWLSFDISNRDAT
jgi:hypothetical protein